MGKFIRYALCILGIIGSGQIMSSPNLDDPFSDSAKTTTSAVNKDSGYDFDVSEDMLKEAPQLENDAPFDALSDNDIAKVEGGRTIAKQKIALKSSGVKKNHKKSGKKAKKKHKHY